MNIKILLPVPAIIMMAIVVLSLATYAADCPEEPRVYSNGEMGSFEVCLNPMGAFVKCRPMVPFWFMAYRIVGPTGSWIHYQDGGTSIFPPWTRQIEGPVGSAGDCWFLEKIDIRGYPSTLASCRATVCPPSEEATAVHLIGFWPLKDGSSKIRFTWKTGVEVGTIGFRLALVTDQGQNYEDLGELIPATRTNGLPQTYSYVWEGSHEGKFALIEVETTGRTSVISEREAIEPPRVFIGPDGVSVAGADDLYDIQRSHDLISWELWRYAVRPGEVNSSSFREGEMAFFRARLTQ